MSLYQSNTGSPTVSVIVWTRGQPAPLGRALASVTRAADRVPDATVEILVIDDGDAPISQEAFHERLRLLAGPRAGAGAAYAAGLAGARGELIAYCDAADEWLPEHLQRLFAELQAHPEVALVAGDTLQLDSSSLALDQPSAIDHLVGDREPVRASSIYPSNVLHRAQSARDVGGFDPSLRNYAHLDLWLRMDEAHCLRHLPVVATIRGRPADVGQTSDHANEADRLRRYHHLARPCRESMTSRRDLIPFHPATWQPPRRELFWRSPLNPYQSFGLVGRQLLLAAARAGIDVTLASPPAGDDVDLRDFPVSGEAAGRIGFSYEYWHRPDPLPTELLVVATMREGTLVPRARVNDINQTAALLYVPCRQNLDSFRNCGVRVPIKVLPYGVDPLRFPFLERPRTGSEPFTFGSFGALSPRKGTDLLLRAFLEEFAPAEPVRLLLKSVDDLPFALAADSRIEVLTGFWTHDALLRLLRRMDSFVLPSRAEGFGLCGLEAMATGLPTIATAWSGPSDYLDPADSVPLHYRLVDAAGTEANGVRYFGQWAEPDVSHLRTLLRWLYEHRDESAQMGRMAAERVHRAWTWDRVAMQLRDDLDLLANGISPA